MMDRAQKSQGAHKPPCATKDVRPQPKSQRGEAGNRHRADALPVPGVLQAKLAIGKLNDPFEHEADRVANDVMRMSDVRGLHTANDKTIQRQCACGGGCGKCKKKQLSLKRRGASSHESTEVPSSVDRVLRSAGQPLDATTRAFMEPRFGYDFSQVRVHANSDAAQSARDVHALAFTAGNHIAFAAGQYSPGSPNSNRLLAHELAHVVQQGGAGSNESTSGVIQRAGDPAFIPTGFQCDTDLSAGRPAGTDLLFGTNQSAIDPAAHDTQLTDFVDAWVAAGGGDDILIHGYASTTGDQGPNWTLSCQRAQSVRDELVARGIPLIHIDIVAHGESTDFGASDAANQHAVISTSAAGFFSNPLILTLLIPADDFAGRSGSRFGVGEVINLDFFSIPPRPASDFGGLIWSLASGSGTLTAATTAGTAIYTAPATADTVRLDLTISSGVSAGRVVASRTIEIVEPSAVRMVDVPGTAPGFTPGGTIAAGVWGAGFLADVFVDPRDVSFQGVVFGEGVTTGVVTPTGSFLSPVAGRTHLANTFGPGGPGNLATGTPVSPPRDQISGSGIPPTGTLFGSPVCGVSDFLWAIPWVFSVSGGARTPFAGGFTANHHMTSSFFCRATIEKGGAGPFCRRIDGTTC